MKLTEAYVIFNNSLHSMDAQLAEAIDRIIDSKSIQNDQLRTALEKIAYTPTFKSQAEIEAYVTQVLAGEPNA